MRENGYQSMNHLGHVGPLHLIYLSRTCLFTEVMSGLQNLLLTPVLDQQTRGRRVDHDMLPYIDCPK